MPTDRPIVHLICNAHIDPVWMWPWEEGLRETISTFHTAAQLLDEFPEFVFNHNESLLYEWVEEYDPPLFGRIQQLVKAGRWNISGGWYLQPDCNMPGGETLVRIIMEGRRYFQEKFGVRPPVAYNFDSFGHPCSLPQLLRQSGFSLYIHCRPKPDQIELPGAIYRWRGMDGSEVLALRPDTGWYGTPRPGQAQEQARNGIRIARETGMDTLVTWGLGDHGGGATRHDLEHFRRMIEELADGDVELRHSTPEAYLARITQQRQDFPVFEGELQRTLVGTYTSIAPIKRQMREGEALLASAERWATIAWWRYGWRYPAEAIHAAWKRLGLNTFHDILCGSLTETAMPGVDDMFGYAHDIARRVIVKAQHALLPNVAPTSGTIPLYVFNPHSTALQAPVGCNFLSAYAPPPEPRQFTLYDDTNTPVPFQTSGSPDAILEETTWQPFIGFVAEVPPLSARRYEIRFEPQQSLNTNALHYNEDVDGIHIENQWWSAHFSHNQAALVALIERDSGKNLLKAPLQLFAMHDVSHAWGGEYNNIYNIPHSPLTALSPAAVGDYAGMEGHDGPALRIIAHGDAWITVECLVGWQYTRAALRFTFYADLPYIDIHNRLYMQARHKMIKLVFPFDLPNTRAICEVPYGVTECPTDATEYSYTRWLWLESEKMNVGIANNGQYGLDIAPDGKLGLSISRGATHSSWIETDVPTDRPYSYMDQTQIDTHFRLLADSNSATLAADLVLAALELNHPFERFFVYHPPTPPTNALAQPVPFLQIEPATVILGALKKAEDDDAIVMRLVETAGQPTIADLRLDDTHMYTIELQPYEIQTLKLTRNGRWQRCNLLEEADS